MTQSKSEENINGLFLSLRDVPCLLSNSPNNQDVFTKFVIQLGSLEEEWSKFLNKYHRIVNQYTILLDGYKNQEKLGDNTQSLQVYDNFKKFEPKIISKAIQVEEEIDTRPINKNALREAKETLSKIKEVIKKREDSHDENLKKLSDMSDKICLLEKQNLEMSEMLKIQFEEVRKMNLNSSEINKRCLQKFLEINKDALNEETFLQQESSSFLDLGEELGKIKQIKFSLTGNGRKKLDLGKIGNLGDDKLSYVEMKEVEVLEKIKDEIQKRSDIIKEKIERFQEILYM